MAGCVLHSVRFRAHETTECESVEEAERIAEGMADHNTAYPFAITVNDDLVRTRFSRGGLSFDWREPTAEERATAERTIATGRAT